MKILARNLVSLLIAYIAVRNTGTSYFGKKSSQWGLWGRSLVGLTSVIFYLYAIDNQNIADAAMLNRIAPFFVTIFAWLFLKEKLSRMQFPALIIIFAAAMLIIKPGFNYLIIPALAGFLSAITTGGAQTLIRYLSSREDPATIVFHFSLVSVVIMFPFAAMDYIVPTAWQLLTLIGTGVFAASGQIFLTYSLKLEQASVISVYSYSNVLFNAALGYFIFNEVSDWWSIAGAVIIISASVYMFMYRQRRVESQ